MTYRGNPQANRAYNPAVYDHFFSLGVMMAKAGHERRAPNLFQYEYAADCWFDGYDSVTTRNDHPLEGEG